MMFEREDYEKLHVILYVYAPRYADVWGKAVRVPRIFLNLK